MQLVSEILISKVIQLKWGGPQLYNVQWSEHHSMFASSWVEGRTLEEGNPDRQGHGDQTVEEALYVIGKDDRFGGYRWWHLSGKNVLGTNVTNRLLPVAAQLTRGLGLVGHVCIIYCKFYVNLFLGRVSTPSVELCLATRKEAQT